jgi:hypothetical protein
MPKVNPETGEPMSDAPERSPDLAGGKQAGDPGMEGASSTGGASVGTPKPGPDDSSSRELPGEKGGAASGGGT